MNAAIGQSMLSSASPFEKAPIASRGIPMLTMEKSLTSKLINIKLSFVFLACNEIHKYNTVIYSLCFII